MKSRKRGLCKTGDWLGFGGTEVKPLPVPGFGPRFFVGAGRACPRFPIMVANLEEGFPSVEEARALLREAIRAACKAHVSVLTVIHGYGSTGHGGKLRWAIRRSLGKLRSKGMIGDFLPGEEFGEFEVRAMVALFRYPFLRRDPNLNRNNRGVTLVFLQPRPLDPAMEYAHGARHPFAA